MTPDDADSDPIAVADSLCEIAFSGDPASSEEQIAALVLSAKDGFDITLGELARRDALTRLLPQAPSAANLTDVLIAATHTADGTTLLAAAYVSRKLDYDRASLNQLILHAAAGAILSDAFVSLIDQGLYDSMIALMVTGAASDTPALRALAAARPDYGKDALNTAALSVLANASLPQCAYAILIVPGYTPLDVTVPTNISEIPAAQQRLDLALSEFKSGTAPLILVSGGSVHPPGTPFNEALMMREYLIARGVSPARIVVDPHARHSTTNLRNAGRFMLGAKLSNALIITGFEASAFGQDFYFGHDILSTFDARCRDTLGYTVGALSQVSPNHVSYAPSPDVIRPNWADPLDC